MRKLFRTLRSGLRPHTRSGGYGADSIGPYALTQTAIVLATITVLAALPSATAGPPRPGIEGQKAPSWGVEQWINLPPGTKTIDVGDFQGKVVYLYGFQSWCPGCRRYGFPTLNQLLGEYDDTEDIAFVAVQTVFEGFSTNTALRAWETARQFNLDIPVGHDGKAGVGSVLMRRYRTGGTPWVVIIDKKGTVRFNDFHITPANARKLIERLRAETIGGPPAIETLPPGRGGQDLVGKKFPNLRFDRWLKVPPEPDQPDKKRPKATLYRWWTDTCHFCAVSLPAIEKLRETYEPKGLRVVCVYHPKPPRTVDDETILATAKRLGYHGTIAVDEDWSELTKAYLSSSGRRGATSVTFLVDSEGVTRFLHPGPVFFGSRDPRHKQADADDRLIRRAIEVLLASDAQRAEAPNE